MTSRISSTFSTKLASPFDTAKQYPNCVSTVLH